MTDCATADIGLAAAAAASGSLDYASLLGAATYLVARADASADASWQAQTPFSLQWQREVAAARDRLAPPSGEVAAVAAYGERSLKELPGPLQALGSGARARALAVAVVALRAHRAKGIAAALTAMVVEVCAEPNLTRVLPFLVCLEALRSIGLAGESGPDAPKRRWQLALAVATRARGPGLVLCCGLSGSGKSFVAGGIAGDLGATVVASDRVRKEMAGLRPTERTPEALRTAVYNNRMTERVYRALNERAGVELAAGRPVVLDATFLASARRAPALAVAQAQRRPTVVIWCEADGRTADRRLQERAARDWTVSDADARIRAFQRRNARPPAATEGAAVIHVDTRGEPAKLFAELLPRVRRALSPAVGANAALADHDRPK